MPSAGTWSTVSASSYPAAGRSELSRTVTLVGVPFQPEQKRCRIDGGAEVIGQRVAVLDRAGVGPQGVGATQL